MKPIRSKSNQKHQSLAKDLIQSLMISITVVLIAIMTLGYFIRVEDKSAEVRDKAVAIAINLKDSLSLPLWNLNKNDVAKLVDSYKQNDFIISIVIRDEDGSLFYESSSTSEPVDLLMKFKIEFEGRIIGQLEINFSMQQVRDLRKLLLLSSIAFALITFAVATFVVYRKVGIYLKSPIEELVDGVKNLRLGHYGRQLPKSRYVEFNSIVQEFNTLGSAIESNLKRVTELSLKEGEVRAELEIGRILQHAMLPSLDSKFSSLISWHYRPATSLAGDWLSFGVSPDERYILAAVGDVTGHGYAQSLVTMAVMGTMWNIVERLKAGEIMEPDRIAHILHNLMSRMGDKSSLNMTASILLIDREQSSIKYVNAGHPFPILLKANSSDNNCISMTCQSSVLGTKAEEFKIVQGEIAIPMHSKLVIYTDGLIDAKDEEGKNFGRKFQRFLKKATLSDRTTSILVNEIHGELDHHIGSIAPYDDICFAVIDLDRDVKEKKSA